MKNLISLINEFIEENDNVNDDTSEQNNKHINSAIACMKKAKEKNLITGPYNQLHFNLIKDLLLYENIINTPSEQFWNHFSFECASIKEEFDYEANEQIYMQAIMNILNLHEQFHLIDKQDISCMDVNSNTAYTIKGMGVLAHFSG